MRSVVFTNDDTQLRQFVAFPATCNAIRCRTFRFCQRVEYNSISEDWLLSNSYNSTYIQNECTCMCMPTYTRACIRVCMYVRVYVCVHICMHVCMYACMYGCMYACMHIYIYIYIYIYQNRHSRYFVASVTQRYQCYTYTQCAAVAIQRSFRMLPPQM